MPQWMQTYTGRKYYPFDPKAEDVCIEDIAHHLTLRTRYSGACKMFYPVALHSLGVLHVVSAWLATVGHPEPRNIEKWALLHDAHEAYVGDTIRPIKLENPQWYALLEDRNDDAIRGALGVRRLSANEQFLIKDADNAMLMVEKALLMGPSPEPWSIPETPDHFVVAANDFLLSHIADASCFGFVERRFLAAWERLQLAA